MPCDKKPIPYTPIDQSLKGYVIEDVWIEKGKKYDDWEPHVQAIKHDNGDLSLRFCYYRRKPDGTKGEFVKVPMTVYEWTIEDLKAEARKHKAEIILLLLKKCSD